MIQGDFSAVIGPKAEGFSGGQFGLGVETLHDAAGELAFGAEPVEQERAVSTQHPGDLLHRFGLRSHRTRTPLIQEPARPVRREIAPETWNSSFSR